MFGLFKSAEDREKERIEKDESKAYSDRIHAEAIAKRIERHKKYGVGGITSKTSSAQTVEYQLSESSSGAAAREAAIASRIRTSKRVLIEEIYTTEGSLGFNFDKKGAMGLNGANKRLIIRRYVFDDSQDPSPTTSRYGRLNSHL